VVVLDLLLPPGSIPLLVTPGRIILSTALLLVAAVLGCSFSLRRVPARRSRLCDRNHLMTTAPAAVSTALQLNDVRKVYTMGDGSDVVALDHATLTLGSDEIVALVGPSGSGKTTLCSIAGGILSATEGTIVVGGEDISDHDAKELTKFRQTKVGFVFQSVNLVPFLNARENLLVVDELGKRTGAPARERADQLLEELGLADRAKNLPSQLSGGQRQRVAIGRALMNDPTLVLFDEPTSALDTKLGEQVMELIRNEMKSRGTAAIVVTHDERITHYCDRSVHITDGRLEA
jgi:putative ABC transport system ATP-binding protein